MKEEVDYFVMTALFSQWINDKIYYESKEFLEVISVEGLFRSNVIQKKTKILIKKTKEWLDIMEESFGKDGMYSLADFNSEIDEIMDPLVKKLRNELSKVFNNAKWEHSKEMSYCVNIHILFDLSKKYVSDMSKMYNIPHLNNYFMHTAYPLIKEIQSDLLMIWNKDKSLNLNKKKTISSIVKELQDILTDASIFNKAWESVE